MANKVVYAVYDDPEVLKGAARTLVGAGVKVRDVFSPFPVHGLDPIIGVKRTRLAIASFMYGMTGLALSMLGFWYFMIYDWPMNIGGKPSFTLYQNLPAFIPVAFEFTVFCAAHGMAITYLIRNKTLPGMPARNPDPRSTDDKFIMEVRTEDNHLGAEAIVGLLRGTPVLEINERER
ncbi:MAG: DUF3341 domain-containing protein [Flavobacteriales bacterium]|nr:hypothetical protein [Flavobacteriales bacterium]MCC6578120.1 DUF3341 domain-containing protein [Flavobacteriales bacterium]NUQ14803.1 DUF3341 domain-containing protein [Flavobacteriales bacterium]